MRIGTILITGIPASGKSTLGKRLESALLGNGVSNVKFIDGEDVRKRLAEQDRHYGYSTKERNRMALEITRMVLEYNREGFICVISTICHVKETRKKMRAAIGNFMEIYLDCPVETCAKRDYKGNYQKALNGLLDNFIGVAEPYQVSEDVELVLHTDRNTVDECVDLLFKKVKEFLAIQKGDGATLKQETTR